MSQPAKTGARSGEHPAVRTYHETLIDVSKKVDTTYDDLEAELKRYVEEGNPTSAPAPSPRASKPKIVVSR